MSTSKNLVFEPDDLQVKADDEFPGGVVEGHASVFGNVDLQSEVVKPGAFRKTVADFAASKGRKLIYFLDSHKFHEGTSAVLGKVIELEETKKGLRFVAALSQVPRAQEVRQKLKEGILKKLSIGFGIVKEQFNRETRIRELLELKLHEISVVVFPANPMAEVSTVKTQGDNAMAEFRRANELMQTYLHGEAKKSEPDRTPPRPETIKKFVEATRVMKAYLKECEALDNTAAKIRANQDRARHSWRAGY